MIHCTIIFVAFSHYLPIDLNFLCVVIALESIKSVLQGHPLDWSGDPCFPRQYTWTGITCSEGTRIRVISM